MVGNRRRILILAAVLLLSGCGSASEAAVSSFSPTPSATPVPEPKVIDDMDAEALPEAYLEAMEQGGTIFRVSEGGPLKVRIYDREYSLDADGLTVPGIG